ncbi:MAG: permease [Phycisphaerae bacterium]|nr:permease [Phycisphaerae bacterium]
MNKEWKIFAAMVVVFLVAYFLPLSDPAVKDAVVEAFSLLQWYAREHTLACVVPALFIAGAIVTFLSQASVLRYMGPKSNKLVAYGVASVSGAVLAVCSCSVLPVFAGIYALGAGLGPASAFLYSGPAINILAIFLTARVLGLPLGAARAVGAVAFAFVIGLGMAVVFRKGEQKKAEAAARMPEPEAPKRPLWKIALYFAAMIAFLVASDWYNTNDVTITMKDGTVLKANIRYKTQNTMDIRQYDADGNLGSEVHRLSLADVQNAEPVRGFVMVVHGIKWYLAGACGLAVLLMAWRWFSRAEIKEWMHNTWDFAKLLVPLLFGGVLIVGFIGKLLPERYVAGYVGDNSLGSNLVASIIGAFWYFATLTEIPICQALGKLGMHDGPMLALLLAGPALSLPNMLVIRRVIGNRKTLVFILLVVGIATISGMMFGALF